jgi:chemotaxis signal transduction protein
MTPFPAKAKPYVGFKAGGTIPLAVDARLVHGVTKASEIIRVPFARRWIRGVIVREGRLIPVLDLSKIASLWNEVPPEGGRQVILVAGGAVETGFLVEDADTFSVSDLKETKSDLPHRVRQAILSGAQEAHGVIYGILKVEAVLAAAEVPAN